MSSQLFGPISPPDGVEPNFIDPPSRLERNIEVHTACLALVSISVLVRVYTRIWVMRNRLGIDDYLCILSYFLTVIFSGLMFKAYSKGIGRHVWDTPTEWIPDALKFFTVALLVYLVLAACVKLSFLFFYFRLFSPLSKIKYFIYFGIVLVVGSSIALVMATILNCVPVERAWDSAVPGACFSPMILFYTSSIFSVVIDFYVLALPVIPLWHLHMDLKRKLKVLAVFSVGIVACVSSIYRLVNTHYLKKNYDSTWNMSDIVHWMTLEVGVGIVCSCLVFLPAFLNRHWPKSIQRLVSRLWSRLLTGVEEGDPSGRKQSPWSDYQRRVAVESEDILVLNPGTNSALRRHDSLSEILTDTSTDDVGIQRLNLAHGSTRERNWFDA